MKIPLSNLSIVACLLVLLVLACDDSPHTSDALLEENFYKHEADFDLLARMAAEDADMIRIAPDFTWHKDNANGQASKAEYGFSDDRWNEYKQLFPKLGKNDGILNYQPDRMLVLASTKGMSTGGSSKGYAYLLKEPSPIVDSLDEPNFERPELNGRDIKILYRKLKDNWYLYYEVSG